MFICICFDANSSYAQCCIEAPIAGPLCAVFAPSGWTIVAGTPANYKMFVFDHWGNRVYYLEQPEVNNPLSGWIPDESLEVGVYVYLIEVIRNGELVPLVRSVTNLR